MVFLPKKAKNSSPSLFKSNPTRLIEREERFGSQVPFEPQAELEVFEDSVAFSNLARDQSLIVNEGESARGDESGGIARVSDEDKKAEGGPPGGGSSDGDAKDPFDGYPPGIDNFFNRDAPTVRPEPVVYTHPGQTGSAHKPSDSSGGEGYHGSE